MPVEWPDGRKEERWMCLKCKSIFVREKSAMSEANSNAVLGEVSSGSLCEICCKKIDDLNGNPGF